MFRLAAEIDCQRYPAWMTRLLLSGWLIVASLALTMQFDTQRGLGAGQNDDPSAVTAKVDLAPYSLTKTVHIISLARQQVPQDSGPDQLPKMPTLRDYPGFGAASKAVRSATLSGFVAEHILYRDGSRSISSRAPPVHFST